MDSNIFRLHIFVQDFDQFETTKRLKIALILAIFIDQFDLLCWWSFRILPFSDLWVGGRHVIARCPLNRSPQLSVVFQSITNRFAGLAARHGAFGNHRARRPCCVLPVGTPSTVLLMKQAIRREL